MNSYIGNYRMPIWALLLFPLMIALFGWECSQVLDNAAYAEMVRQAPEDRDGWLVELLPRPALFGFFALCGVFFAVYFVMQGIAAVTRRQSFVIDGAGVRRYALFTGRQSAMAWGQIQRVSRYRSALTFKGLDRLGRKSKVVVSLLGHNRKRVAEVVALYRPDLAKALR